MSATKRVRFSVHTSQQELEKIKDIVKNSPEFSTVSEFCSKATTSFINQNKDKLTSSYRPNISNGKKIRHYRNATISRDEILNFLIDDGGEYPIDELCNAMGYEPTLSRQGNIHVTMKAMLDRGWLFRAKTNTIFPLKSEIFNPQIHTLELLNQLHQEHGTWQKVGKELGVSKSAVLRWKNPVWRSKNGTQIRARVLYSANSDNRHVRKIILAKKLILVSKAQNRLYTHLRTVPVFVSMSELEKLFGKKTQGEKRNFSEDVRVLINANLIETRINGEMQVKWIQTDKIVVKNGYHARQKINDKALIKVIAK